MDVIVEVVKLLDVTLVATTKEALTFPPAACEHKRKHSMTHGRCQAPTGIRLLLIPDHRQQALKTIGASYGDQDQNQPSTVML